jgi:ATP-dependent protease ClpP protease subunit
MEMMGMEVWVMVHTVVQDMVEAMEQVEGTVEAMEVVEGMAAAMGDIIPMAGTSFTEVPCVHSHWMI